MTRTAEQEAIWQQARKVVLARDGYRCVRCGETRELHVHHLVPRALEGQDDPANLITLCSGCHAALHPNLQVRLSRRAIERWALRLAHMFDRTGEIPPDSTDLPEALHLFGADHFREGQLEVVMAALRGESMLVVRPTGSGKTLCFQLPAILRPGTSVVLSPLRALMADQVRSLQVAHIPATYINSDITGEERRLRYQMIDERAWKLLYCTPERFDATMVADPTEIQRIANVKPSFLVVDEAHCVDRWGDDFRPNYGRLNHVRRTLGTPPVLAFTATAGETSQHRILDSLGIPDARIFVSGVDRPNIALVRRDVESISERCRIIARLIQRTRDGKVMIFVPTLKDGERVRAGLQTLKLDTPFYHGKLPPKDREFLLNRFTGHNSPQIDAIICTNAFGMGLDVPNIRVVVHWVQPASVEDYLQEFGRAGRDGKPALAVVFKRKDDTGLLRFMADRTAEEAASRGIDSEPAKKAKYERIAELDEMIRDRSQCFRRQIIGYFEGDERPPRPSLALRILRWAFSRTTKVPRGYFCCDHCNPRRARSWIG